MAGLLRKADKRLRLVHFCTYRTAEDVRITANKEVISRSPSALCAIAPIPGPSEQLFAHGISRFPALCRSAAGRAEAYERALAVSLPFLPTPAVSPTPAEPTSRSCPVRSNLQLRDRRRYRRETAAPLRAQRRPGGHL